MANVLVEEWSLQGIANAIRSKNGTLDTYTPAQMEQAILDIPQQGTITPQRYTVYGDFVELAIYSGGWVESYTIGSPLSLTQASRSDWKIMKCNLESNKKYLISTYVSDGDSYPIFITDSSNNVIACPSGAYGGNHCVIVDTSDYNSSNGLVLHVGIGDMDAVTYYLNQMPCTFNGGRYVFCREIIQEGANPSFASSI